MEFKASFPTDKLSTWYFATRWARMSLQARIKEQQQLGLCFEYNDQVVAQLEDLEVFLNTSWEVWMESLNQTMQETANHG